MEPLVCQLFAWAKVTSRPAARRCAGCFRVEIYGAQAFTIKDGQGNMEIRTILMVKFDRWREKCLAILENGLVISCQDRTKWIEWTGKSFSTGDHLIAENEIEGFYISTEFLGIDLNASGTGPPRWFETMVFRESANGNLGAKIEYGTVWYSTMAEALAGHVLICEKVMSGEIGE